MDRQQHYLDNFRNALSVLVYPVQAVVNMPFEMLDWADTTMVGHETLQEQNAALKQENLRLQARAQRMTALEAENARLRALMESARQLEERVLVAEILRVDLDPFRHQLVINKGSRDGVYNGQPLLDASGVMGQVIYPGVFTSAAMLITDPSHALPVEVNRNGLRSIAVGTGELDRLNLPYLPNSADIKEGDLLVTSGLGGRFPPGYPVGEVMSIKRDPGLAFAQVSARPLAALNRSREMLLVWSSHLDQENAVETTRERAQ